MAGDGGGLGLRYGGTGGGGGQTSGTTVLQARPGSRFRVTVWEAPVQRPREGVLGSEKAEDESEPAGVERSQGRAAATRHRESCGNASPPLSSSQRSEQLLIVITWE